ncbi:MAG: FtsX-like permease family protein [Chloroflexota bacterium]|nr:FtsX-like permease family protein [Chloroflexota bacterium]
MDNIFGLSMTTILIVTLSIMALCLLTTAIIALRNRVIFKMAVRNIPRRKAQTILIMVGLMLSTLIIAASLTTGDTIDYSIKRSSYEGLAEVDETIAYVGNTQAEGQISVNNIPIPASIADELEAALVGNPDVEGIMPILTVGVPAVNLDARLSEPAVILTGVDPARIDDFGGLATPDGQSLDLASMPEGSVIISEDLANNTNTQVDDTLTFYIENQPHEVTVGGIAKGSILTGFDASLGETSELLGIAAPLSFVQSLTGLEGQARYIAVSNAGGIEGGERLTDQVEPALRSVLDGIEGGDQLGVNPVKQDAINGAELFSAVFMSLFIVLGLFSAAAGILLIFLIFMMLAAERRSEMGMARAVGMKRSHLVQQFIAEGTAYDLGAALIGAAAGVLVAFVIAIVMSELIGDFINITPHATFRSLLVAYSLGVTVTFLTIIFASVRSSRLNIVAAIRDLPDNAAPGTHDRPRWRWWSKLPRFAGIISTIFWLPIEFIWNVILVPVKLVVWLLRVVAHYVGWGVPLSLFGALLMLQGLGAESIFWFSTGLTMLSLGLSLFLSRYLPKRPVYTFFAAVMLIFWLTPTDALNVILPDLGTGGFEMFFVSGLSMVTFSTLIIMWNAEILIGAMGLIGRLSSRWLPALKTAVAYPLASKGRTGLTIAMFAMVIFSLVTLTTINSNFIELFSTEDADAGWDIRVETSPTNPIDDLRTSLAGSEVNLDAVDAVGRMDGITYANTRARNPGEDEWSLYGSIGGLDADYMANAAVPLEARAPGYETDEAVWEALRSGERVAIVDSFIFTNDEFGGDPDGYAAPDDAEIVDGTIPAIPVELQSERTGMTETVTIIGIIDAGVSTLFGLYMAEPVFTELYGTPDFTNLFVRLDNHPSPNSGDVAKQIEAALLTNGVQAESIQNEIDESVSFQTGFFQLLQGFMGLGLLVGIAALCVISFRSVVERRQQIGMLRAIGYQRNMVALSFLLESLVIAILGVVSGTVLALILSYNLINSEDFQEGAEFTGFVIPWGTVIFFVGASIIAAGFMTWVPARKAASVPIADALRYE